MAKISKEEKAAHCPQELGACSNQGTAGIPFKEFKSVVAKLRHAFTCTPAGVGLLSPCSCPPVCPNFIYHHNCKVLHALEGCPTLLRESTQHPTQCCKLICGWSDFIGIVDAPGHCLGGVIFGESLDCTTTVFRWEWPDDIKVNMILFQNPKGTITNSDLEIVGPLILWLAMEGVCGDLQEKQVTLFTVNSPPPPVGWVRRLASKCSLVAKHLVQVLSLRLKSQRVCLLTTMHIEGQQNAISVIPFRLFGSNPSWKCDTEDELLTMFNCTSPLPFWQLWMVFHPNFTLVTHVILALRMTPDAFCSGRLEMTSQGSKTRWQNWCTYVKPTGVNPYLQHTPFQTRVRCLTGFAA